jgi:hypothetical protein
MTTKSKTPAGDVAHERDRQNREAIKGVRATAKRAGEIAEHTSAYDVQRKSSRTARAKPGDRS